ncbi:hypothetical protein BCR34DRAFT_601904 [Clohesyomyces aquaticus]|uniref:Uncharacterized protein n=1 Tax=Clohesyomyces aquaticus TaxID=1231657 RepID=A0A1Y1ZK34_9PLEO|nr:hypothetical protein BCR34DRAFT_601904 [Clohesyomyces aquaticus]
MAEDHNNSPTPWAPVESSVDGLEGHLDSLYWEGVTREMQNAIISLQRLENVPSIPEEDDITKRIPAESAFFVTPWAAWKLSDDEWDGIWECSATVMAEHQGHDLQYRRARMLLIGLGLLDISRIIEFRDPPLKSLEGRVQGSLSTSFVRVLRLMKHLQMVRPYDPMAVEATANMDEKTKLKLSKDIRKLQEQIDDEEDFKDENKRLRAIFRTVPEWARRIALPFGNVHARTMFGPLTFEIGAGHSQGGALVTSRLPPDLSYSDIWRYVVSKRTNPALAISPDKKVFRCNRTVEQQSIHASTIQVLGGLFSGHNPKWKSQENEVIRQLIIESLQYKEKPTKSQAYNARRLREASSRVVDLLNTLH